jgi:CheY-like chemotaxis protein
MATKGLITLQESPLRSGLALGFFEFAGTHAGNPVGGAGGEDVKPSRKGSTAPKRIGIVDDEVEMVLAYSMMVKKWGHQVEFTANDGPQAVQACLTEKTQPDVILLDYRMKLMNGFEAAKKILSHDPGVKIVIVSADDSIREEAIGAGYLFLLKPFSMGQLKNILANL